MDTVLVIIVSFMVGLTWLSLTSLLFNMGDYYKTMNKTLKNMSEKGEHGDVHKV